jgi:hypothetical protein
MKFKLECFFDGWLAPYLKSIFKLECNLVTCSKVQTYIYVWLQEG